MKAFVRKFYIYVITNIVNNKQYVGKTVDVKDRWRCHKKNARNKTKGDYFYLHRSINKYGVDSFRLIVVDEFDNEDDAYWFETWWIEFLETNRRSVGYNLNAGGMGGICPTEETRKKLIAAQNRSEIKKAKSERMKKRHRDSRRSLGGGGTLLRPSHR